MTDTTLKKCPNCNEGKGEIIGCIQNKTDHSCSGCNGASANCPKDFKPGRHEDRLDVVNALCSACQPKVLARNLDFLLWTTS